MSATMPSGTEAGTRVLGNYIGGAWVPSTGAEQLDVTNPATGEVLARVPLSGRDDVEAAVAAARAALPGWRRRSTIERARWLFGFRQALEAHQDELAARGHARDGQDLPGRAGRGRPHDRDGRGRDRDPADDAGPRPRERRDGRRLRDDPPARRRLRGHRAVQLPGDGAHVVPALRHRLRQHVHPQALRAGAADAGDGVQPDHGARRPAARRRQPRQRLGRRRQRLPRLARASTPSRSSARPRSPSTSTSARPRNGKRVQALGGAKNYMVVMPDAVMDKTVDNIIGSAFGAAGQRCMAGSVIVTVGDAKKPLLDLLHAAHRGAARSATAWRRASDVGPLVSRTARDRVSGWIDKGVAGGRDGRRRRALAVGREPGRRLRRPDDHRQRHAGHGDRPRGDLRAGAVGHPRRVARRRDRDRQRQPLRQRHVDLHRVGRGRPQVPPRRRGRHGRRQHRRRRAGRLLPVLGLEGLVLRRPARARHATRSTSTRARRPSPRASSRAARPASSSSSRESAADGDRRPVHRGAGPQGRPRARLPLLERAGAHQPARPSPGPRAAGSGTTTGNRYLDFASQLVNASIGHQHPKIVAGDQGAGRPPLHHRAEPRQRQAGRAGRACWPSWRRATSTWRSSRTAAPRRTRTPCAWRASAHRPPQDHGAVPLVPRGDARRDHGHRRPAPLAVRAGPAGLRAVLRAVPLPLVVPRDDARGRGVPARARARRGDPAVRGRRRRWRRSWSSRSSARTASSCRPTATCRASGRSRASTASC